MMSANSISFSSLKTMQLKTPFPLCQNSFCLSAVGYVASVEANPHSGSVESTIETDAVKNNLFFQFPVETYYLIRVAIMNPTAVIIIQCQPKDIVF